MSSSPNYCEKTCRPYFKKLDQLTPCNGCQHEKPEIFSSNQIALDTFLDWYSVRSDFGVFDFRFILDILKLEGLNQNEIMDTMKRLLILDKYFREKLDKK